MSREFERQQQIYDTAALASAANIVLLVGEIGVESDSGKFKIGDGSTRWNDLPYANQVGEVVADASKLIGEAPVAVMPDRVLTTNGARPVGKGELLVKASDYDSFADAVSAAASATTFGPATVYVPPGTFDVSSTVTIPSGVTVRGEGEASKLVATSSMAYLLQTPSYSTDIAISGVTLDGAGLVSSVLLRINDHAINPRISRVTFESAPYGVQIQNGNENFVVARCTFRSCSQAINMNGGSVGARIRRNVITEWDSRGISIISTASDRYADDIVVSGNTITNHTSVGSSRYPVRFEGTGRHQDVRIRDNRVVGPDASYNDTVTPGTADQLSFNGVDHLVVADNISAAGGDAGITITNSTGITVTGNICRQNDTTGLYLVGCKGAAVTGNTFVENGQSRLGGRGASRSGIRPEGGSSGLTLGGNAFIDEQATPTMIYGVSMRDVDNVTLGPDTFIGVATPYYDESGNTNLRQVTTQAL